jgi:hypothetical protein
MDIVSNFLALLVSKSILVGWRRMHYACFLRFRSKLAREPAVFSVNKFNFGNVALLMNYPGVGAHGKTETT